ncbi:hypothetical protein O53_2852 [Microcystis aeruginosa TAIHU98]|uniref:Uncharacterized protein n=1 Tax=Microcystis aeruginosa TAIHU98 TaxID=1134457 RepID=L7E4T0_MICAE|nr:hypothetical protein O53_2852 [Microcystis aeruginosa TAIHU98]
MLWRNHQINAVSQCCYTQFPYRLKMSEDYLIYLDICCLILNLVIKD